MTEIELLAPARNADIGIEAIKHGADAVYIGAPRFGARVAAGNSLKEIQQLVAYAHQFAAKVYVTVNTILKDSELKEVESLVRQLYDIHVDALIVQDLALKKLDIPPIPLHASTQMDNRTPEKVCQLHDWGFEQVVLARELSLDDIQTIHQKCPDVKLEAFVHGALCVSMSGQCYASECLFGRSANRGECAQVCRMAFDLIQRSRRGRDVRETVLVKDKHLLSLKDLCHIGSLQKLIDAGVSSLKIEGRLKDVGYVKNVTAAYSEALNMIVSAQPDKYVRASMGQVELKFQPDVNKSFNRGFTSYFLYGRSERISSFDTPKAMGEEMGVVKEVYPNSFTVAGLKPFANGDGLCFVDSKGKLFGFRINKVENGRLYPREMPHALQPKMRIFRNFDKTFEDMLQRDSAERFIPVDMTLSETPSGFRLSMADDYGMNTSVDVVCDKELARTHQSAGIERQLSRLGGTIYRLRTLDINYKKNWFIPASLLVDWRRQLVASVPQMTDRRKTDMLSANQSFVHESSGCMSAVKDCKTSNITYLGNVYNDKSMEFLHEQGYAQVDWAYEKTHPQGVPVMFCRHCIRYSLGWCYKNGRKTLDSGRFVDVDLYLQLANGRRFRLDFDCRQCLMKVVDVNSDTI